jgi:hypothetical protein
MSAYAEIMQAARFTEEQNKLIMSGNHNTPELARICKRGVRAIQRQRSMLKRIQQEERNGR